jgi:hypothetical protein
MPKIMMHPLLEPIQGYNIDGAAQQDFDMRMTALLRAEDSAPPPVSDSENPQAGE